MNQTLLPTAKDILLQSLGRFRYQQVEGLQDDVAKSTDMKFKVDAYLEDCHELTFLKRHNLHNQLQVQFKEIRYKERKEFGNFTITFDNEQDFRKQDVCLTVYSSKCKQKIDYFILLNSQVLYNHMWKFHKVNNAIKTRMNKKNKFFKFINISDLCFMHDNLLLQSKHERIELILALKLPIQNNLIPKTLFLEDTVKLHKSYYDYYSIEDKLSNRMIYSESSSNL